MMALDGKWKITIHFEEDMTRTSSKPKKRSHFSLMNFEPPLLWFSNFVWSHWTAWATLATYMTGAQNLMEMSWPSANQWRPGSVSLQQIFSHRWWICSKPLHPAVCFHWKLGSTTADRLHLCSCDVVELSTHRAPTSGCVAAPCATLGK